MKHTMLQQTNEAHYATAKKEAQYLAGNKWNTIWNRKQKKYSMQQQTNDLKMQPQINEEQNATAKKMKLTMHPHTNEA